MEKRLTSAQLDQIIAEIHQLSQRQNEELTIEQVREVLADLNMSPELLEEALVQLRRRAVLRSRRRRNLSIIGTLVGISLLFWLGFTFFGEKQQQILDRIIAQQDRITLAQDDGGNLSSIYRNQGGELYYRVTLNNAPVGQKLSLSCNWIAPGGQIVHQNNYQTKEISTSIWNTYCRYTIGNNSPQGVWKVEAFLGDRQLSEHSFTVE